MEQMYLDKWDIKAERTWYPEMASARERIQQFKTKPVRGDLNAEVSSIRLLE